MAKVITSAEFEQEVLKSDIPVMVDFYATWCGPCKMIAPALEELATEMEGKAKVLKVDIDQSIDLARTYEVKSVPTLIIFKDGAPADQIIGAQPKAALAARLEGQL